MAKKKAKTPPDKFADYRKKKRVRHDPYRPKPYYASVDEAKEIFKQKYRDRNYEVKSVRRQSEHFLVSFGQDDNGRGLGPYGLSSVLCNWPYLNDFCTVEAANQHIRSQWLTTGEKTNEGNKPDENPSRKRTKNRN